MNEQHKPEYEKKSQGSHEPPAVSEPSSTPASSGARRRPYFNTASDGRVTLTFPSSGAWNSSHQASSPQPARYEPVTPASELSIAESSQPTQEKTAPLRLMTDEALAARLDSSDAETGVHSDPGGSDLEAWIESSRQTIIRNSGQAQDSKADDPS